MATKVHALLNGLPLCRFTYEVPAHWPSGHTWTDLADIDNITCSGCREKIHKDRKDTRSLDEITNDLDDVMEEATGPLHNH